MYLLSDSYITSQPREQAMDCLETICKCDDIGVLTAVALGGDIEYSCFVAPSDCGLGLYARVHLSPGQLVGE